MIAHGDINAESLYGGCIAVGNLRLSYLYAGPS
jgi:hypothetical protein